MKNVRVNLNVPLSSLITSYSQAVSAPVASITCPTFDGDILDLSKNPAFYDMDDDEIVDVKVDNASSAGEPR